MPSVKQQCQVCGGESFTTSHGLKVCNQCGSQEEHYVELLSQETLGEVDRSRLIATHLKEDEEETAAHSPHPLVEKLNNWTSYEAYNLILYEWTKALLELGASPKVETITFKLWVAYLQRLGIAFTQEQKTFSRSSMKNTRDRKIIHEKAESVSSRSLHSYSMRRKKKKAAPTKLDKIKDKIELSKMKAAVKKKQDSSFMNTTLASELSKSLNEFEASMLSDSNTSYASSRYGDSRRNTSARSEMTSAVDDVNHMGPGEGWAEVERDDTPLVPRKSLRRNDIVLNWIRHSAHIYDSASEDDQHQEDGQENVENDRVEEDEAEDDKDEEEDGSDHSGDGSSQITSRKSHNSGQKDTAKKKSVRSRKPKKPKYNKLYRKVVQASDKVSFYRASTLPFIMHFSKLLGILYLAVLLAQEHILLSDIIRWCREGHIPYYSAPYLLQQHMEVGYYDLFMMRSTKKLPNAQEVQVIAGRLATFLSIQYVPLPPTGGIVKKFVKLLNLPEQVVSVAESLVEIVDDMKMKLAVPPVESLAMASIILALKVYCGLDSRTEVLLSHAGTTLRAHMPDHTSIIPFSWQHWQRHISRLVWVCCQVDPPAALHWQHHTDLCSFSPTLFSRFFWREDMWRIPRTSRTKKAELQTLTEELLQHQGHSLEEAIMQPPFFRPSRQPLHSTIEQLVQRDGTTGAKEMHKYIKAAEELMEESFANHSLNWFGEMDAITTEAHKCGSRIQLLAPKKKRKDGVSYQIYNEIHNAQGQKEKRTGITQELFIPDPMKNFWNIKQEKYSTWEKLSASMPFSFRWLVDVGSQVCEAPQMQLLLLVCRMQNKMKRS